MGMLLERVLVVIDSSVLGDKIEKINVKKSFQVFPVFVKGLQIMFQREQASWFT